jgi:hypothetical protein
MTRLIINVDVGRTGPDLSNMGFEKKGRTHHYIKSVDVNSDIFYKLGPEHFQKKYEAEYGNHGSVTVQEEFDENVGEIGLGIGKSFVPEENNGRNSHFTKKGELRAIFKGKTERARNRSRNRNNARAGVGSSIIGPSIMNPIKQVHTEVNTVHEVIMKESKEKKRELVNSIEKKENGKIAFKDRPLEQKISRLQEIASKYYKSLMRRKYELFENIKNKLYTLKGLNNTNNFVLKRTTNRSRRGRSALRNTTVRVNRSTSRPRLAGRTIGSDEEEEIKREIEKATYEQEKQILKQSIQFYHKLLRDYGIVFNNSHMTEYNYKNIFE